MVDAKTRAIALRLAIGNKVKKFGPYDVSLYQHKYNRKGSFSVVYGKQVWQGLSYAEACHKLGEALMHAMACDGIVDNERD
jgi:hypothetical protein